MLALSGIQKLEDEMRRIVLLFIVIGLAFGLAGCSDEYLSLVQDRAEDGQEVARLSLESDHLIRAYMVSDDGVAVKVVQILEFPHDGQPYRILVEIDPFAGTFLGFEGLSSEADETIQAWQEQLLESDSTGNLLAANDTELADLWFSAVVEARENYLFLTEDQ